MKFCPTCKQCYEDDCALCVDDQTALSPSRTGTRFVAHKYSLDRVLCDGPVETIYAGIQLETDRPVAIKLLLPQSSVDEEALKRFRLEAYSVAHLNTRIDHQRIARTYDYGLLPDGAVYMAMELVAGESLREHIDETGPLTIATAVRIARQVADGLDAAHRCGVVHGDLEPSNVILARDYYGRLEAKVIDFGFAKLRSQLSKANSRGSSAPPAVVPAGTPLQYFAPERRAGHNPDERADIYSLGMLLYEMLAGRLPLAAQASSASPNGTEAEEPSVRELRADVPEPLAELVRHALRKKPSARLHSAAEFAKRLRAIEASLTRGAPLASGVVEMASKQAASQSLSASPARAVEGGSAEGDFAAPPLPASVDAPQDESRSGGAATARPSEISAAPTVNPNPQADDLLPASTAFTAAAAAAAAVVVPHAATAQPSTAFAPAATSRLVFHLDDDEARRAPAKSAPRVDGIAPSPWRLRRSHAYIVLIALALGITSGVWINTRRASSSPTHSPGASVPSPPNVADATAQTASALSSPTEDTTGDSVEPTLSLAENSPSDDGDEPPPPINSERVESQRAKDAASGERQTVGDAAGASGERVASQAGTAAADWGTALKPKASETAPTERASGKAGPCTLSTSESSLSIRQGGGAGTIGVRLNETNNPAARVTVTTPNWPDIVVFPEPQASRDGSSVRYSVRSVSKRAGAYRVTFKSPCGSRTVPVTVVQP